MMTKNDPSKPRSNDEKFKPQNVADESHGSVSGGGRKDRNMDHDVSRGSEPETSKSGG
ncbi:MAG: hypothetical protein WA908_09980 [Pontixanthobacter sp.]